MKLILEYLTYIKVLLTANSKIHKFEIIRELVLDEEALYRYKIYYSNGDLLEAFEKFQIHENKLLTKKYSFHWQDKDANLITRWVKSYQLSNSCPTSRNKPPL